MTILNLLEKIQIGINDFLLKPEESKSLHRTRINIRKLRSLLSLVKPLIDEDIHILLQGKLRNIAIKFSRIRQLDVIADKWGYFLSKSNFSDNDTSLLLETVKEMRKKESNETSSFFNSMEYVTDYEEIQDRIFNMNFNNAIYFDGLISKRAKAWGKEIKKRIKLIDYNDISDVHRLRIKMKKYRYTYKI